MSDRALTSDDLRLVLSGDAAHIHKLMSQDQAAIVKVAGRMPLESRILPASAVRRVLLAYSQGAIKPREAQAWASFVRRGYISSSTKSVRPIEIPFEAVCENAIAEALARLDEIGELVDGSISQIELRELIDGLA